MSREPDQPTPYQIIEQEKKAYLKEIPPLDSEWPTDIRCVYEIIRNRIFELGLEAQEVREKCGIGDHNIHIRFGCITGYGIKEMILVHRMQLAKRLLPYDQLSIGEIALAVGYENPSGFSATFKRRVGCTPSEFRSREEN